MTQPTLQNTQDIPDSPPRLPSSDLDLSSPWPRKSDIEILTTGPAPGSQQCGAVLSDPDNQKDTIKSDLRRLCEVTSEKKWWQVDCTDKCQNQVTGSILSGMDTQYLTSSEPLCPENGGVSSPQQIITLRKDTKIVRVIVLNVPYEYVDTRKSFDRKKAPATGETNSFNNKDLRGIR